MRGGLGEPLPLKSGGENESFRGGAWGGGCLKGSPWTSFGPPPTGVFHPHPSEQIDTLRNKFWGSYIKNSESQRGWRILWARSDPAGGRVVFYVSGRVLLEKSRPPFVVEPCTLVVAAQPERFARPRTCPRARARYGGQGPRLWHNLTN